MNILQPKLCLLGSFWFCLLGVPIEGATPSTDIESSAYVTAKIERTDHKHAILRVTLKLAPGFQTYSTTQGDGNPKNAGGPSRTKISLNPSAGYAMCGEFVTDRPAEVKQYEDLWPGLKVQTYTGTVTWSAPVTLAKHFDAEHLALEGHLSFQFDSNQISYFRSLKFVACVDAGAPTRCGERHHGKRTNKRRRRCHNP
ncbi:MAG: hypothetical protein K8T25_02290 [Planctomycetia bacterium]|nr:hypothetical protein [Planctomycetia bacterium]